MASSKVDLPEPFSPAKKVTAGCNWRTSRWRTAGEGKGILVEGGDLVAFQADFGDVLAGDHLLANKFTPTFLSRCNFELSPNLLSSSALCC